MRADREKKSKFYQKIFKFKNKKGFRYRFKKSREVEQMVDKYWKKELTVEPQSYFSQLRIMKNMIYAR